MDETTAPERALLLDEAAALKATEAELRSREAALVEAQALLQITQEITRAGSFEWDIATNRVTWSGGLYRIFGVIPDESPATFEGYLERVHPDEREHRKQTIEGVLQTGQGADGEHRIVRPDGEVRWIESRIRVLTDEAGAPTRLVGVCQDITERRRTTQELEDEKDAAQERALHDPLTGLPNRTLALDRLEHAFALAQRRGSEVGVLFIDIDGFKRINDRHGHPTGDQVLKGVAERMNGSVRGSDTVARIGGDEFLVICEEVAGAVEALETAERVLTALDEPFALQGSQEQISVSIGISNDGDRQLSDAAELVAEADAAMYEAKRRGPGGIGLHPVPVRPSA